MKILAIFIFIIGVVLVSNARAALVGYNVLTFEGAPIDPLNNTVMPAPGSGSWFAISPSPGQFVYTPVTSFNGLDINGGAQPASGSHSGLPDGSESPYIDLPWSFFGNTGMHMTTSPVNVISQSGNTVLLDFSGWSVTWTDQIIELGGASWGSNPDGIAILTCAIDCSNIGTVEGNEAWTLDYTSTVQSGAFLGVQYALHLESVVPLPAAVWLFVPGLLSLVALGRRKIA